jgi:hypothetical protein
MLGLAYSMPDWWLEVTLHPVNSIKVFRGFPLSLSLMLQVYKVQAAQKIFGYAISILRRANGTQFFRAPHAIRAHRGPLFSPRNLGSLTGGSFHEVGTGTACKLTAQTQYDIPRSRSQQLLRRRRRRAPRMKSERSFLWYVERNRVTAIKWNCVLDEL